MNPSIWQPILNGSLISLRPLKAQDFEELYAAASDPLIWAQHPEKDRYKREKFQVYFNSGIESHGALAIVEPKTNRIIGCSRFTRYEPEKSSIEVGYTFLTRDYWGKGHNRELKSLMLGYAFQYVETVLFYVGDQNIRSQMAVKKIGAIEVNRISTIVFKIDKETWRKN